MTIRFVSTSPAANVTLPSPSINSAGQTVTNQTLKRSVSGGVFTFQHGPERYQHDLTFEAMTETEVNNLFTFLETIGWAAVLVTYEFTNPWVGGIRNFTSTRIIGAPTVDRKSANNNDVRLKIELPHAFSYDLGTP
jgi:hypothetical protein